MSIVINTTTPEGIILAADSRQSYRNMKGMARIGSENAMKLFQINKRIGAGIAGLAFLVENGAPKNLSQFIEEYKHEEGVEDMEVEEVAQGLNNIFNMKYKWKDQLDELEANIGNDLRSKGLKIINVQRSDNQLHFSFQNPQGIVEEINAGLDPIEVIVAGYNQDGSHQVFSCRIPGQVQKLRDSYEIDKQYGSSWIGQGDVITRIVLGFDGRIVNTNFVKEALGRIGEQEVQKQLQGMEYNIQWGTMTLQDAVDFATLLIHTTSAIQRFSDGINADPGDMPGVGGPIDVAVITPDRGFVWVKKKKLIFEDVEVDLESKPYL
jgi:20S proteasome alpha/beta subunit